MSESSSIVSFVLRFVFEEPLSGDDARNKDTPASWYGVIRHVQSDTEHHLTSWAEIEAFIEQYVDLGKDAKDE